MSDDGWNKRRPEKDEMWTAGVTRPPWECLGCGNPTERVRDTELCGSCYSMLPPDQAKLIDQGFSLKAVACTEIPTGAHPSEGTGAGAPPRAPASTDEYVIGVDPAMPERHRIGAGMAFALTVFGIVAAVVFFVAVMSR
jgi:hypothetical protein